MSTAGLPVGRLVRISVNLSPTAAPRRGFGDLLVLADVVPGDLGDDELRSYTSLESAIADEVTGPALDALTAYFGQRPRPKQAHLGKWLSEDETAAEAIARAAQNSGAWYGVMFASETAITDDDYVDAATLVGGLSIARWLGITTNSADIRGNVADNLAARLKDLSLDVLGVDSATPYAVASVFGRLFSVDWTANRSTITLMYKQLPGVTPSIITETEADNLKLLNWNIYTKYANGTAIVQYGKVSSGKYADLKHGLDWIADAFQNAYFNRLFQSPRKVPQTNAGMAELKTVLVGVCREAVNNGFVAPGVWNSDGFGQIEYGTPLTAGYYVYMAPIETQDQSIREQRIAVPAQIALKTAGAVHEGDIVVDVNQ
jgi:hypothetical protein